MRGWGKGPTSNSDHYILDYQELSYGNCNRLRLDMYHNEGGYGSEPGVDPYLGSYLLTHVQRVSSLSTIWISVSSSETWNSTKVGDYLVSENAGCSWDGPHVHQVYDVTSNWGESARGNWSINNSLYENGYGACPATGCANPYTNNVRSNWTHTLNW